MRRPGWSQCGKALNLSCAATTQMNDHLQEANFTRAQPLGQLALTEQLESVSIITVFDLIMFNTWE